MWRHSRAHALTYIPVFVSSDCNLNIFSLDDDLFAQFGEDAAATGEVSQRKVHALPDVLHI